MSNKILAAALAVALSSGAHASVIFSDDFEANAVLNFNVPPSGWTITNGTVETVGLGFFGSLCAGSGKCVDLDGSTGDAGVMSRVFALTAGSVYDLTFDLAGNRRGGGTETGTVTFGTSSIGYSLPDTVTGYLNLQVTFAPGTSGNYTVSFANDGGDNLGAILDNVVITRRDTNVPAPVGIALFGLAALGIAGVRRRA